TDEFENVKLEAPPGPDWATRSAQNAESRVDGYRTRIRALSEQLGALQPPAAASAYHSALQQSVDAYPSVLGSYQAVMGELSKGERSDPETMERLEADFDRAVEAAVAAQEAASRERDTLLKRFRIKG
ncbi:MAG: hypothetical protein AB1758_24690, partial [Candidatus Eremiobacterota bacterium]